MKLLIDECLHESLVEVAHAAGFEATHVNYLGLSGKPDWVLTERVSKDEFTFVTNNRVDFLRLLRAVELHSGLIVLVPNVVPSLQRALFKGVLSYSGRRDLEYRDRSDLGRKDRAVCRIRAAPAITVKAAI